MAWSSALPSADLRRYFMSQMCSEMRGRGVDILRVKVGLKGKSPVNIGIAG
jgi:hypothetical protein